MYAFIIFKTWMDWILDNDNDLSIFLKDIGTPCVLIQYNGLLDSKFNDVPGFYIRVPQGWAIKYTSKLLHSESLSVADNIISLAISEISES